MKKIINIVILFMLTFLLGITSVYAVEESTDNTLSENQKVEAINSENNEINEQKSIDVKKHKKDNVKSKDKKLKEKKVTDNRKADKKIKKQKKDNLKNKDIKVKEQQTSTLPEEKNEVREQKAVLTSSPEMIENQRLEAEVKASFEKWEKLQNEHELSALKKIYTDDYVNTDGYNREQLFRLMASTYDNYPDLKTIYKVEEIIANHNFATVYVSQNVTATTKAQSKITNDKGVYNAQLRMIMYLKKVNHDWKIYSEQTVYETSILAYGAAKNLKAELKVPQKVLAGSDYCAGVKVDIPENYTAIASINTTQLVEGFKLNGENFRQVEKTESSLERILKANSSNNNEAVVVSIGFAERSHDMFKKAKIELAGLLMLMQRVDVIPVTSNFELQKDKDAAKK